MLLMIEEKHIRHAESGFPRDTGPIRERQGKRGIDSRNWLTGLSGLVSWKSSELAFKLEMQGRVDVAAPD